MTIHEARTEEQIRACHTVMVQLRPHLADPDVFTRQVLRQMEQGYRLAFTITEDGEAAAVAGYRILESLSWGKYLYVDDLATDTSLRSQGHGQALLSYLKQTALDENCGQLHLDSGVQRYEAHRFYLRERLLITAHHFAIKLQE